VDFRKELLVIRDIVNGQQEITLPIVRIWGLIPFVLWYYIYDIHENDLSCYPCAKLYYNCMLYYQVVYRMFSPPSARGAIMKDVYRDYLKKIWLEVKIIISLVVNRQSRQSYDIRIHRHTHIYIYIYIYIYIF